MLRHAIIYGGTFIHTTHIQSEGFKILHGNIAIGAFHDSGERFDAPRCHPNTRVAVLAEIMQWIQDVVESEGVLWLYGFAGAGKSAIAQTIAEMCAKMGLLMASFFFSRTSQSRNNEKRLIASIAYQLALSIPATRSYVESSVQIDPAIFDKSLDTQIETLIIRPLENAYASVTPTIAKQWPRLIIIDGLDECHGPSVQCSIIRVLSTALLRIPVPLILLVASRPEPHIRNAFNILNKCQVSHHVVLNHSYQPDADIKKFLLSRFKEIKENHPLADYIPECWPSAEIINRLVRKSSGQFIYASTVMKYLDSPNHRPMKRLDVIIGLISVDCDMPHKELDALYSHLFSRVEDFATTLKIFGFLLFRHYTRRATPEFLAVLLGLDEEDIYLSLSELHSILSIPPPNASGLEIRMTHASLESFLVDKRRSGKYYLDEEAFHTDIAQQCVRQISKLTINNVRHNRQRLEGLSDLEAYLITSFHYHCTRASTDCVDLKNELMQIRDLRPWFKFRPPNHHQDLPSLFAWLYKADTAARELSSHIQSLWDQYLVTKLNEYTFNGTNVDIAGLLFFPPTWNSRWSSIISGIPQVPDIFQLYRENILPSRSTIPLDEEPYRHMLNEFFEDKTRSGKHHLDGTVYAHTALECFRKMVSLNDNELFNPFPSILGIDRPDAKLFMSITEDKTRETCIPFYGTGLDAVSIFLLKASPLTDLCIYLRNHPLQNPAKAKVHHEQGFASLRFAVELYLDKCKHHLGPKVLRRPASCPRLDFKLEFGKRLKVYDQRQWSLARDGLTRSGKLGSVGKVATLRQMRALQFVVHGCEAKEFDTA